MRKRGYMNTETKQQLRDRVAFLTADRDEWKRIAKDLKELNSQTCKKYVNLVGEVEGRANRATLAAYALLATLTAIIIMEFVL